MSLPNLCFLIQMLILSQNIAKLEAQVETVTREKISAVNQLEEIQNQLASQEVDVRKVWTSLGLIVSCLSTYFLRIIFIQMHSFCVCDGGRGGHACHGATLESESGFSPLWAVPLLFRYHLSHLIHLETVVLNIQSSWCGQEEVWNRKVSLFPE